MSGLVPHGTNVPIISSVDYVACDCGEHPGWGRDTLDEVGAPHYTPARIAGQGKAESTKNALAAEVPPPPGL